MWNDCWQTPTAFDRARILVDNAGACVHSLALEVTDEQWRRIMDVNLNAGWLCSQVIGGHIVERGSGNILNPMGGAARSPTSPWPAFPSARPSQQPWACSPCPSGDGANLPRRCTGQRPTRF
ncbi:MAG TPA: SDR family NAD(P)-dependent oxidoreductase [Micrococcaceae bacterium]|nr:SDR family NAD(P)-dependent oxidoreductase [Micrococcaceae bacterium]